VLCCDWSREEDIPQSFATAKNRSSSPNLVRHIGWHLAGAREYLLTSVASTVSRRIYIYTSVAGIVTHNVLVVHIFKDLVVISALEVVHIMR